MIVKQIKQPEFVLQFTRDEGITLVAALKFFAEKHPQAQNKQEWLFAAEEIERVIYNK